MEVSSGGGLYFKGELDTDQINKAIEQSIDRFMSLQQGVEGVGDQMDSIIREIGTGASKMGVEVTQVVEAMRREIDVAYSEIDAAIDKQIVEVNRLTQEYEDLSSEASKAFMAKDDDTYRQLEKQRQSVNSEIQSRKAIISEIEKQADVLQQVEQRIDAYDQKIKKSSSSTQSLTTQITAVKDEMAAMRLEAEKNGTTLDENNGRYAELQQKLQQLTTVQKSLTRETRVYGDQGQKSYQGVISGIGGLSGALSAVTGATSLFSAENENLQKVMAKLQSVMAIVIGLQQVSATLHKDSAFQLTTARSIREWWNRVLEASAVAQKVDTAATVADTAAKSAQAVATTTATTANRGLAASFRLIGAAIKSIPGIGWLLAALTGLSAIIAKLANETSKADKKQKEFYATLAEGVSKPITSINRLQASYNRLGDDMQQKQKFVRDNKKEFEDLGITIRSVSDAERMLTDPANVQKFIAAQITKAKATIQLNSIMQKQQKLQEKQMELDAMPETVRFQHLETGEIYEQANQQRIKLQKEVEGLTADLNFQYQLLGQTEQEYVTQVKDLNQAADDAIKGSIAALKKTIQEKTELMELMTDPKQRKAAVKEIEALQKELDKMSPSKSKSKKDPFEEQLQKIKKEYDNYLKYTTSTDEEVRKSAETTFKKQLEQGATYLEYLINKRDELLKKTPTAEVTKQIKTLNNEIADQTKITDDEERKRKDDQLQDIVEKYYLYYDTRKKIQEEFDRDMLLLQEQSQQAQTASQRKFVDTLIANRQREYDKAMYEAGTGDTDYDALVRQYENYEQQRDRISEEYERRRAEARLKGNEALLKELDKQEAKDLQAVAMDELVNSDSWRMLFDNMDELTAQQIDTLIKEIEAQFATLSVKFDPIDIANIRAKLNEAKGILIEDNPFKQVGESLKAIFNEAGKDSKDGADNIKTNWKNLAKAVEGSFNFVQEAVNSADVLKGIIGDVGVTAISSLGSIASASIATVEAIKTAERASAILTTVRAGLTIVQSMSNVFNSIFRRHDKRLEKQIRKHAEAIEKLRDSYTDLEKAMDKALGSNRYATTQQALRNLQQQQKEIQAQADKERDKKKTDKNKLKEYESAMKDVADQQKELIENMRLDILQTDARTAAQELGNAFIDAFMAGEDAAAAFGKKVDDIVANIIRNMLIQKVLEEPVGKIIDRYTSKWYDDKGVFAGADSVIKSSDQMGRELAALSSDFATAMNSLPDNILKYFTGDSENNATGIEGVLKGASEETMSMAAGQLNAIRINQSEALEAQRQQLAALTTIQSHTAYIEMIYRRMEALLTQPDVMRSQGLV